MSERIVSIEKVEDFRPDGADSWDRHSGFCITTTDQAITLSISNSQSCCEDWGYFLTEDEPTKFIGAELRGVTITDTNRSARHISTRWIDDDSAICLDAGDVMFVDIETDRGILQFVAYNAHNGYYGHAARVVSRQLKHEVYL